MTEFRDLDPLKTFAENLVTVLANEVHTDNELIVSIENPKTVGMGIDFYLGPSDSFGQHNIPTKLFEYHYNQGTLHFYREWLNNLSQNGDFFIMNVKLRLELSAQSSYKRDLFNIKEVIENNVQGQYRWSYSDFILFKAENGSPFIEVSMPIVLFHSNKFKKSTWEISDIEECISEAKSHSEYYLMDTIPYHSIIGYVERRRR